MSEKNTPTIQEALNAVMRDVHVLKKSDKNKHQGFNFRGIDSVMNACGPAFREHGVITLPRAVDMRRDTIQTRNGGAMSSVMVCVEVEFIGPAGDSLTARAWGEAFDSGDKATAKAHSVAYRTVMLQTLCLPTDEPDPDEYSYEMASQREAEARREQQKRAENIKKFAAKLLEAEQAGDMEALHRVKDWAQANSHGEEYRMVITTINRLEGAKQRQAMQEAQDNVQQALDAEIVTEQQE